MKEEDFIKIIRPLSLLPTDKCEFLSSALMANFTKWKESNILIPDERCPHKECIFSGEDYCKCQGCEELS